MKSTKNIALIGMMGTGKSAVGKELSNILTDFSLVELDELIVEKSKMTINDIFKEKGENFFREIETQILKESLNNENIIISTGGGIVERAENIELVKNNSFCVYLKTSEETLFERLKNATDRPLLKSQNEEELKNKIHTLLTKRSTKYELADIVITTDGKQPQEIANEIIERQKLWTK